jgi:hypothetical protein
MAVDLLHRAAMRSTPMAHLTSQTNEGFPMSGMWH